MYNHIIFTYADSSTDDDDDGANTGAIVGGVVGGICGIILLIFVIFLIWFCYIRNRRDNIKKASMYEIHMITCTYACALYTYINDCIR